MAKTATASTPTETTNLSATEAAAGGNTQLIVPPANGLYIPDDDFFSGPTGLENVTVKDVSLPRWTILQGLSPQVNPRKDEYVEGAKVGMLYNTATGEIADEKTFIFAAYEHRYVEWVPRDQKSACPLRGFPTPVGGGLYRDYGTNGFHDEADNMLFGPENEKASKWDENGSYWTSRGNEIQDTGTWYTIDPHTLATAFIAMAKTQFSSSKKMMAGIRDERQPIAGGGTRPALLFYRAWTLTTALRSKAVDGGTNEWFVWAHKPAFKLQEHVNAYALRDLIMDIQAQLQRNEVTIDVGVGENEGSAAPVNSDTAAM